MEEEAKDNLAPRPYYAGSNNGVEIMTAFIKSHTKLPGLSESRWQEKHEEVVGQFLTDPQQHRLFLVLHGGTELVATHALHAGAGIHGTDVRSACAYFVKKDGVTVLTPENLPSSLQYGVVRGDGMHSLLHLMQGVYGPQLMGNRSWPDSTKKELAGQYHQFMASLTETANQAAGKTVLYLPPENLSDVNEAAKDKELVQQLESIVIYWTRQIKEVVNHHDNADMAEASGPREEINFWKSRTIDLSGISEQLHRADVKKVIAVLEAAKSSYPSRFQALAQRINDGSIEANNNLKFLESIREPCEALSKADPKQILAILPSLLAAIRMIWTLSRFYNTVDRLTGLLRKISNEIINRCCAKIDLREIFDGDVEMSMVSLQESIECGVKWKQMYRQTAAAIAKAHAGDKSKHWRFDEASIFAQIDAFVQRCRDLLEVCEGQMQFARKSSATKGASGTLPEFGATRGQEITKGILGIEASFESHIDKLRRLDYDILDVKTSRWHDDHNVFKNQVKDLEVMYTNVISTAFEGMQRIPDCVALLEIFYSLAKLDAIKRCVEKKTAEVYELFIRQVERTRHEFDENRRNPPIRESEPEFAGAALWARSLGVMMHQNWLLLHESSSFLVHSRETDEAEAAYRSLMTVVNDFKLNRYQAWVERLNAMDPTNLVKRLETPLMRRATALDEQMSLTPIKAGQLICNFDRDLASLFIEVVYWEKLHGEITIPYAAHDICNQREKLRVVREHVMLIVRAYNSILDDLSTEERRLFSDHIRRLDKRINQGLSKLTWASKGVVEFYVKDCLNNCAEVHGTVTQFKTAKDTLAKNCRSIASLILIKLDKNAVYDEKVFEAKQQEHRTESRRKMESTHQNMRNVLRDIYQNFKEGSGEVQREWRSLLAALDKSVEQALRQTVKKSLQELSRAINGDQKVDAQSLFKVNIVLESQRVEYRPTMINLTHVVNIVAKELISIVAIIPRLKDVMLNTDQAQQQAQQGAAADGSAVEAAPVLGLAAEVVAAQERQAAQEKMLTGSSFYHIISNDHDTLNIVVQIMNGMSSAATEMQKYQSFWDKYKPLWEMDVDAIIRNRKYAKVKRSLQQYEAEIMRYKEQQNEIEKEDVTYAVMFIKIDCTLIKKALVDHCVQWQNKLTGLLNQNALADLRALHDMFHFNTKKLLVHPSTLDHLSENIGCLKELVKELPKIEAQFEPLEEMYAALKRFEVQIPEAEMHMVNNLHNAFEDFKDMLGGSEKMLEKSKQNMKRDLEASLENYNTMVMELRQESAVHLPYSSDMSPGKAFDIINDFKARATQVRGQQAALKPGTDLFNIELPEHKELKEAERDIDLMEQIWTITVEWMRAWDSWKTGLFQNLNVEEMETAAGNFNKKIGKLGRDIKHWKVWEAMRDRVEQFRQTMPLILDLKNKAMRERHWDALRHEINKDFDPSSSTFTLEQVFALGLHSQAEFIGELSANANKELSIEVSLNQISQRWQDVTIDIVEYKEVYHKIRSTEDLFQVLEDDSVSLSTMKASKFYASFQEQIDYWDATLNVIFEVVDLLLTVQRKWMYLESIFMAGGDIAKQLPNEYHLFREVNDTFKRTLNEFHRDPNAQRACKKPGLSQLIMGMDEKLETIQKCLDQYLETKRMIFPRFYFVSDDDLLEILGQSRDPTLVQKHIKKCFEGVKFMDLVPPGKVGNRTYEARAMIAPDNETADFVNNVIVDGAVEMWLVELEKAMQLCLQKLLANSLVSYKGKKETWVKVVQGQLLITTGAIAWTSDCSKALVAIQNGNKNALKVLKKKQVGYLNKLTDMVRGQLTIIERSKLVALITMEIHNRDVMERMIKANCSSVQDFEWLSQLRFLFYKDQGQFGLCSVKQTNSTLEYSYEYQGNNGRLVVTPLTDRCVLTLTTAMYLNRGGNPLGPAGTGKTETVKDLGKNLAKYVVVINCSDGQDYKSVGRIFSGLVQSGSWGCFDEFNRIKIEVISVVAMQVLSIVNAMSAKQKEFFFMGQLIKCNPNCGIFITMNPGYAGRTELPDNLKALMRPVAMMTPDLAMIAEVMLASEGFREGKILAKKTITLYNLMIQQLSKQDHYDYGLRNLKAVLNMAGSLKRADPGMNEEAILMRALRDMNLPKFIKDDERLFRLLLGDLFPSLEMPVSEYGQLQVAIERSLEREKLQKHPFLIGKIIQLYDSKLTRHCNMLVGRTMAGKSVAWKTLAQAKTDMGKEDKLEGYHPVHSFIINPKSVSLNELYGAYDLATFEWADGVLSTIFKSCAESDKPDEKWIMFDGPVDALWIESMNSVMDDNKILTLINGDRIPLTNAMSLLFEVEDLSVASPATVSRAGMIYLDVDELGWGPYVQSWLESRYGSTDPEAIPFHRELFNKYVVKVLEYKSLNCREPIPITDFNAVQSLTTLFDALATKDNGVDKEANPTGYLAISEKWFVFCLIWSVMAAVDEKGRKMLDIFLRDIEAQFPPTLTVYDYFFDAKKNEWEMWESKVPAWRPLPSMPFHKMIVPTTDTVRNAFVLTTLVLHGKHTLVTGQTGTGKTVLVQSQLAHLPSTYNQLTVNFSAATASSTTQEIIEGVMEKRSKDKFGPLGGSGKRLLLFIDDFNMPKKTSFESPFQPALELIRLWIDYGGWYDRQKCQWRYILDTQLICAMGPPSGGRQVISARTQSRFNVLNLTFPSDSQVVKIFDAILTPKFADFDNEIKPLGLQLSQITLSVYNEVQAQFLPTPDKFHYLFNIRDVAKVVQGLLQAQKVCFDTRDSVLRLWVHECLRVFSDRFLQDSGNDSGRFRDILSAKLKEKFDVDWKTLTTDADDPDQGPIFCSFMRSSEDPPYEEVTNMNKLKGILEEKLADYNMEPKLIPMNLVLFKDALRHICRIHRVLKQPRGNLMLVGVGGSGRQSLTKLASYMCEYQTFMIEITKMYRSVEFHEDLKTLYTKTGVERKPTTFLFNDTQIKEESFLEDINNILSSGEVPNLFGKDELPGIYDGVRKCAKENGIEETPDELWRLFIENVRGNLHIVLAMSPVGAGLRNRCRMYPGLVNCTTIDWFHKWPVDALQEVAIKFLQDAKLESVQVQASVASVFSFIHMSVITASSRMLIELKRNNYVTPTNYLELVKGYNSLLDEKRTELGDSANKLANGLAKLEESRVQVERMSIELEKKKVVVAQAQKDCEELLVEIVSERRVADEQKKQVETDSARIAKEEIECQAIATDAQADLDVALPALERAMAEVDKLDKNAISEVKAYNKPPKAVETVMSAVMTLFGQPTDWANSKKVIGESNFLQKIKSYDKDNVSTALIAKIKKFVTMPDFMAEEVRKVSSAAAALCTWCHAIYIYANVAKEVAPKRARLKEAMDGLASKQAALKLATEALAEVIEKVNKLKQRYDDSVGQKNKLREEAEGLEAKLNRADQLVKGLSGEYTRWQSSIGGFRSAIADLVGDCLVASACLSYAGPFDTTYRDGLVKKWLWEVKEKALPFSQSFNFAMFLAKPTDVRDWNIQGLPSDNFSTENGVIVTRGSRWPLMIDPQGQANKWIRNMEGKKLRIIDLKMKDFLREVENGISYGLPVLLQDVLEELDPSLEPVLSKAIMKQGSREFIRLGDKELDYSRDFRLYITTKLGNPHYTPEVSTKTTVVNFAVKQQGLEAQLLGIVVQKEQPLLEKQKSELVIRVAAGKRKLVDLENLILRLLSESTGSLLDDEALVKTLQQSKVTSEEVTEQLKVAEETEVKIDVARESYRSAAIRASIAYFVLNDMSRVDPMYQYSLDAYVDLFYLSIDSSRDPNAGDNVAERCKCINDYHTLAVYQYVCRGLFERHKLLFSFQLCVRILQNDNKIPKPEFDFFCYGGVVVDRTEQRPNPCPDWIDGPTWDNLTELDKVPGLMGLASSFEQAPKEWKRWYMSSKPEIEPLPADMSNKLSELQQMCILRSLRPDRVLFAANRFVGSNLGTDYADPPAFDLRLIYKSSSARTPLIFVLSPGVDPTAQVFQLAASLDVKVDNCALGQGQAPVAVKMIEEGLAEGKWVFLANCHLMLSWMPALEKIIEGYIESNPHPRFRLWLSSSPHPQFPITILQRGIKMTTEPPRGLRANMLKLYNIVSQDQFERCKQSAKYKKLLFSLCWFHAILLERRKFKSLGFNIPYDFNESDFSICHDLVIVFLDEYPDKTPFDAMRYLIAEANYGGRVTDDWDRRLVNVYINQFFCDEAIDIENFPLSELPDYFIPAEGDLNSYKEFIKTLPQSDHPAAFGQHPNADISSQIEDTADLLSTIVALQPKVVVEGGESNEQKLARQAENMAEQVPAVFDMRTIKAIMETRSDPEPMKVVLFQEVERYNKLLLLLHRMLKDTKAAVSGLVIVTPELEEVIASLLEYRVPKTWSFCYPSSKPLGSWMRDLVLRCELFQSWVGEGMPKVFWLPGFTYPTGFLTALLQTTARKNGLAIDSLSWEFPVLNQTAASITSHPKEGAYLSGFFLEGARWDNDNSCLGEPLPMELTSVMPIIHFKPVDNKKKAGKGIYVCPLYMYPVRTGTRERPSFVISVELKSGKVSGEFWTKRGTAMLLATSQ